MRFLFFFAGTALLVLSLFANCLGIDNDPGWGMGRTLLLLSGLLLALPALAVHLVKNEVGPEQVRQPFIRFGAGAARHAQRAVRFYPLTIALTVLIWGGLAAYGGWITSAGRFPYYPPDRGFYPLLAEAFLHGQLSLLEQPDPALLALPDPYDMIARDESGAKVVWDASLFNGKYYVYWGPAPALIMVLFQAVTGQPLANAALVFAFYAALAAVLAALLYRIRGRFFPRAPGISVPIFLLPAALNLHTLWLVGRPSVYEAAIISGQLFLFLGLLLWIVFLEREHPAWLALAGLSWGLAVGSRVTLVVSVAIYTAFALIFLIRVYYRQGIRILWKKVAPLVLPLALVATALAAYNFARFGSPFETGQRYQLSLAVNPEKYFSPAYIPTNLYMWIWYRFDISETFPFFPFRITYNLQFPDWAVRPQFKMFDREFYGLLPSAPVTWLLVFALPLLVLAFWRLTSRARKPAPPGQPALEQRPPAGRFELISMVALAGFLQFMLLMNFFYAATRYGADFIGPGVLLAAIVTWEFDARIGRFPRLRAALWIAAAALAFATAVIGAFASFYVPKGLVRTNNPVLYQAVANQWSQVGRYVAGILRLIAKFFIP